MILKQANFKLKNQKNTLKQSWNKNLTKNIQIIFKTTAE
jgi:hypothetical protein